MNESANNKVDTTHNDEGGLCGIPANGGSIGYAGCDLPWGHEGDMHANRGDGYYNRSYEEEHKNRQTIRGLRTA